LSSDSAFTIALYAVIQSFSIQRKIQLLVDTNFPCEDWKIRIPMKGEIMWAEFLSLAILEDIIMEYKVDKQLTKLGTLATEVERRSQFFQQDFDRATCLFIILARFKKEGLSLLDDLRIRNEFYVVRNRIYNVLSGTPTLPPTMITVVTSNSEKTKSTLSKLKENAQRMNSFQVIPLGAFTVEMPLVNYEPSLVSREKDRILVENVFSLPSQWIKDDIVANCHGCNESFNLLKRKVS
jgi:hypothetical protein